MRSPSCRTHSNPRHGRRHTSWALALAIVGVSAAALSAVGSAALGAIDLAAGTIAGLSTAAREGTFPNGRSALSMSTGVCNIGTENIAFEAPMNEAHPVVVMQVYRLRNGRFEQIGISDARHEYFALSNNLCGSCGGPSPGTYLGVGCSTESAVGINASQVLMGPRSEIDPYLGTWSCFGSHFAGGLPSCESVHGSMEHGPLDHRLVVADTDLAVPDSQFFYEAYWITEGDTDPVNNVGSREMSTVWTGSSWAFLTGAAPLQSGPSALRWAADTQNWADVPGDGRILVMSSSVSAGGGNYDFEYAVYNLNSARRIGKVAVPTGFAEISQPGFHDPDQDAGNDWTFSEDADEVRWETTPESVDPDAPALSYGLLYNYRFRANSPPVEGQIAVEAWQRTGDDTILVDAMVPSATTSAPGPTEEPAIGLTVSPLPVLDHAVVSFRLDGVASVSLEVFDASGRRVRVWTDGSRGPGAVEWVWNGRSETGRPVPPGVYYARVRIESEAGALTETVRLPVLR